MPELATDPGYSRVRYAYSPYVAYANPAGAASQDNLGVPFLLGNDRYQVVVCASSGDSATAPSFRYWYAGGAPWGEVIAGDSNSPEFHTVDEDGEPVMASLELPFKEVKSASNVQVDGLYVEFTPQPLALTPSEGLTTVGFSVRVEGYGLPAFNRDVDGSTTSGVLTSEVTTVEIDLGDQSEEPWPNTRTVYVPIRFTSFVRAFRVIYTDMFLIEHNRTTVWGKQRPLTTS